MNSKEIPKAYDPAKHESNIYKLWASNNAFASDAGVNDAETSKDRSLASKEPFCIIMPPPNANGSLHAGHLMYVVEDIATRYARMQGRPTLWLPGTDHAGIETQVVYERELEKKGITRFDLGPQKFYDEVWKFVDDHKDGIINQFKAMGFSADYNKLKYTLDEDIVSTVYDTFEQMYKEGHVYRGNRIVNWCTRCQAAFPDIETDHMERTDTMYTLDYGTIQIATTRPETIFADSAVAVNPNDSRYTKLVGQMATIPLTDRSIPIIADEHVSIKDGTGALKVTPGHDMADYEIGKRHNLPEISVVDFEGNIINAPSEYNGLSVSDARVKVVAALKAAGKLVSITPLTHSVTVHDRCKTVIEPLISEQWFLRVAELNKPVVQAITNDEVVFYPSRFKSIALNWLENEHDWCISRPGWWGIRIPVYYKTSNDPSKDAHLVARTETEAEKYYGKGNYRAETDTFDTWFSSSQWPYATLMATGDFEQFFPTSLMATARDILHKWVTRMIMFSLYKTGRVPFENVYLWGMVTDEKGQKLSKSKGNYDDPMKITAKYGTDALRLALSIGITPGNDGKISDEKIKGYRNFCNKLWNVARYTLSKTESVTTLSQPHLQTPADHWMAEQLNQTITITTKAIDNYRYSEAGQAVYSLLWDKLADQYIEYSKQTTNPTMLAYSLDIILRLLHPFAPFITEAIWQELPWCTTLLITEQWPNTYLPADPTNAKKFEAEIISILASKQKDENKIKIAKLQKELTAKYNLVRLSEAKLSNSAFVDNAPTQVVKSEQARVEAAKSDISKLEASIEDIKAS